MYISQLRAESAVGGHIRFPRGDGDDNADRSAQFAVKARLTKEARNFVRKLNARGEGLRAAARAARHCPRRHFNNAADYRHRIERGHDYARRRRFGERHIFIVAFAFNVVGDKFNCHRRRSRDARHDNRAVRQNRIGVILGENIFADAADRRQVCDGLRYVRRQRRSDGDDIRRNRRNDCYFNARRRRRPAAAQFAYAELQNMRIARRRCRPRCLQHRKRNRVQMTGDNIRGQRRRRNESQRAVGRDAAEQPDGRQCQTRILRQQCKPAAAYQPHGVGYQNRHRQTRRIRVAVRVVAEKRHRRRARAGVVALQYQHRVVYHFKIAVRARAYRYLRILHRAQTAADD